MQVSRCNIKMYKYWYLFNIHHNLLTSSPFYQLINDWHHLDTKRGWITRNMQWLLLLKLCVFYTFTSTLQHFPVLQELQYRFPAKIFHYTYRIIMKTVSKLSSATSATFVTMVILLIKSCTPISDWSAAEWQICKIGLKCKLCITTKQTV